MRQSARRGECSEQVACRYRPEMQDHHAFASLWIGIQYNYDDINLSILVL